MNSISPLLTSNNQLIKDQMQIEQNLIKRDIYSMENSTNSDNTPSKNNMKIIIPLINPNLYFNKSKTKKASKGTILDFDKVLSILTSNKDPKRKKQKRMSKPLERNLLNRKTIRPSSIKKKRLDKDKEKEKKNKTIGNNLYGIDNFISSTMKIVEKKEFVHIECPKYKEIFDDYVDDHIDVSLIEESDEDISNERYMNLHWVMEEKEINRRINLNSNSNNKKKNLKPKEKNENIAMNKKNKLLSVSQTDSTIDEKHCA